LGTNDIIGYEEVLFSLLVLAIKKKAIIFNHQEK